MDSSLGGMPVVLGFDANLIIACYFVASQPLTCRTASAIRFNPQHPGTIYKCAARTGIGQRKNYKGSCDRLMIRVLDFNNRLARVTFSYVIQRPFPL